MKRPWNIISPPVYSLVTYDENGKVNMNMYICFGSKYEAKNIFYRLHDQNL